MPEQKAFKLVQEANDILKNFKKTPKRLYSSKTLSQVKVKLEKINESLERLATIKTIPILIGKFIEIRDQINVFIINICKDNISGDSDEVEFQDSENSRDILSKSHFQEMALFDLSTALKLVTVFEGEARTLNNFLSTIEYIAETLKDDIERGKLLDFILRTRISDRVVTKLGTKEKPTTIADLVKIFKELFTVKKSALHIQNELARIKQGDQNIQAFSTKIESLMTDLSNVQISNLGNEHKAIIIKLSDTAALDAFKAGLNEPIKTTVFAAKPANLADAVKLAAEVESLQ